MDEPLIVRCRAATARRVTAVVLLNYMAVAAPVHVLVQGYTDGVLGIVCGCPLWLVILFTGIAHAIGLRCRMILDAEGVTFVEIGEDVRFRWDEITAIEIGGDSHTWTVTVRTADGRQHRPGALKCLKWFARPRSLSRAVALLEEYRAAAR